MLLLRALGEESFTFCSTVGTRHKNGIKSIGISPVHLSMRFGCVCVCGLECESGEVHELRHRCKLFQVQDCCATMQFQVRS